MLLLYAHKAGPSRPPPRTPSSPAAPSPGANIPVHLQETTTPEPPVLAPSTSYLLPRPESSLTIIDPTAAPKKETHNKTAPSIQSSTSMTQPMQPLQESHEFNLKDQEISRFEVVEAVLYRHVREVLSKTLSTGNKIILCEFLNIAIEHFGDKNSFITKGNCEEIVAEDFLILKEDNPVTESKMKSQEDTSVKLGGDCENDSSQTEPIQERCVKGGRKKGETKSILEERHKARLEEQERKLIEEGVRRSQRIKDRNNANLIMEIDHYIPENFKEAMEDELSEIEKHKVWTLVPRGNGMKVINSKWVYSTKKTPTDGIYKRKARLVAVGCNQRYGVDYKESFSPVFKKESLRTIVALATQQNLTIKTYDVKTAYLYGKCWNKKINEILYQLGMIRTKCDPCVYKLQRGEEYAILGLYVDDLIIAGTSKEINDNLASEIEKYVTLTEKKDSEPFIGIEIKREEDGFYLSQTHYIDTILHRFGLEECNSVQTPGDQNQNLDEYLDSKPVDKTVYQEMIGSLMYLSTGTRPDISFNVSNLSQYSFEVLEHPAYSPDLVPSDYFLFGLLKKELKGKRFDSDEDVQKVVQDFSHAS
ncbi:hypothetical protein LAZ67_3004101 [Cordylochernes scorpioides]|uniref:Reverse transcriptase Ty1/copia-type domain-containing protein n=1 Tax=Cordylochernes scorpioides TaxID=51811 RepID=A0ABY6K988_9ARAC|nr:hypothetical protein LAZ67_3004101 [Cordylochernes scorpioides]